MTLSAANEGEAPITKVEVTFPDGAEVGETTRTPAGWKASRTESGVAWTGGKVEPETFEQWGFELEGADQPGTLTFTVTLTAGGETEQVRVPVTAAATKGAGTAPAAPATTAAPAAPSTTAAALASADTNSSGAEGRATLALWLAVGGLLLGVAALIITLTRRGGAPPSTSTPAAPQDF